MKSKTLEWKTPNLETPRLLLRPWREDEAGGLYQNPGDVVGGPACRGAADAPPKEFWAMAPMFSRKAPPTPKPMPMRRTPPFSKDKMPEGLVIRPSDIISHRCVSCKGGISP